MSQHDGTAPHVATPDECLQAMQWLRKSAGASLGDGEARMVLEYAVQLVRRDELDLLQSLLLHYVDLTTVYIIRAILEHGQSPVGVKEVIS